MKTKKTNRFITILSTLFVLGFIAQHLIFNSIQDIKIVNGNISVTTGALCAVGLFIALVIGIYQVLFLFIIVPVHFLKKHVVSKIRNPFEPMTQEDIEKLNRPVFPEYIEYTRD